MVSFSFFYRIIGESTIDSKPFCKIAVFSYADDFIFDFIQELRRFGIKITHVYAAPHSISRLAISTCFSEPVKTRIFVASLPGEKLFLVSENSELAFIRKIPSSENSLLQEDTHSINMTVDYCFQSLRVQPFETVMINQSEISNDVSKLLSVPFRSIPPPQLIDMPAHMVQDYLAPVAGALHYVESPETGNILPSGFVDFYRQKKLLTAATIVMFTLTLLLAGYLVTEWMIISGLKSKIDMIKMELGGSAAEIATFRKLDAEANLLKQPLDLINKNNSSLNPATALAALNLPESPEYTIKGVTIQGGEGFLTVQIEGTLMASGYTETQAAFEAFVARISKIPGYAITSNRIDIVQKSFGIQARYDGGGQRVK